MEAKTKKQNKLDIKTSKDITFRIIKIIDERGITQKELAKLIGKSYNTFSLLQKGERRIDLNSLIKISEILKVSADYLLGYESVPTTNKDLAFVCNYLNLSETAVNEIKKLTTDPRYHDIIEDFTNNENAKSNIVNKTTSKMHVLLHLILEMDFNLFCQVYNASIIKKELRLEEVDNLTLDNENFRLFWEYEEKALISLFSIQEAIKRFINDFEKENLEYIESFKAFIPSTRPTIFSPIEINEIDKDKCYFREYREFYNNKESNETDNEQDDNHTSELSAEQNKSSDI